MATRRQRVPHSGRLMVALALAGVLLVTGAGSPAGSARSADATIHLVGAGSTFDAPFFAVAFAAYARTNPVAVEYRPVGSGAGIQQFISNQVDFGATDVPMNQTELAAANSNGSGVLQLPILLGGVALTYNLAAGNSTTLRVDGATLADIFLGKVTRWNDQALAGLNPGVKLPSLAITPVHRLDSSGTNYIVTDYLSAISGTWATSIGKGKAVPWPVGLGARGNPGVAAAVAGRQGAIGYVELAYAIANHLPYMLVQNQSGAFVLPTAASVLAAADRFRQVNAVNFSIVNAPGPTSYPIAGYSWALVRAHHANVGHGAALIHLFRWLTTAGQSYALPLHYVPIPRAIQQQSAHTLDMVHVG